MSPIRRFIGILATAMLAAGCAAPGDQVRVPTMSVEAAWHAGQQADFGITTSRMVTPSMKPALPYPIVSAPDIRLAYIKPWTDEAGNRHFGNWVAIPVDNPTGVLPDGTREPMDNTQPQSRPAPRAK